jgi:hypothetical protein
MILMTILVIGATAVLGSYPVRSVTDARAAAFAFGVLVLILLRGFSGDGFAAAPGISAFSLLLAIVASEHIPVLPTVRASIPS